MRKQAVIAIVVIGLVVLMAARPASALSLQLSTGPRASEPMEWAAVITLVTVAPALLVMLTSFTRIVIVLALMRQALGLQQTPPNMVLTGIALLLTVLVMAPVWKGINDTAVAPYLAEKIGPQEALARAEAPLRDFMLRQTRAADLDMARSLLARGGGAAAGAASMPFYALVPAFITSELTAAFRIGFLIYLPFLAIDLVVAAILMALGMFMLSPTLISLPLKLLVFTMASGWSLLVSGLVTSFR